MANRKGNFGPHSKNKLSNRDMDGLANKWGLASVLEALQKVPYGSLAIRYYNGETQSSMAQELGISQPSISYCVSAAIYSASVLLKAPVFDHKKMIKDISKEIGQLAY